MFYAAIHKHDFQLLFLKVFFLLRQYGIFMSSYKLVTNSSAVRIARFAVLSVLASAEWLDAAYYLRCVVMGHFSELRFPRVQFFPSRIIREKHFGRKKIAPILPVAICGLVVFGRPMLHIKTFDCSLLSTHNKTYVYIRENTL